MITYPELNGKQEEQIIDPNLGFPESSGKNKITKLLTEVAKDLNLPSTERSNSSALSKQNNSDISKIYPGPQTAGYGRQ